MALRSPSPRFSSGRRARRSIRGSSAEAPRSPDRRAPADLTSRDCRLKAEDAPVEFEFGFERADDALGLAEAVLLAFELDVDDRDALALERSDDRARLARGHDRVLRALEDDERR